jgi:hypothetical protein
LIKILEKTEGISKQLEIRNYIFKKLRNDWLDIFKRELVDCKSVLDLGCGCNSPLQFTEVPYSVGVELYQPYIEQSKSRGIHNEYIRADVTEVEFSKKAFDAVLAIDIIEHLDKGDGYRLIERMQSWATKKIIVTTTNGFVWQDDYDGNALQKHISGWDAREFRELGFKLYGYNGWKPLRGYLSAIKYKPVRFWSAVSILSQPIAYYHPDSAFQLFAAKYL